MKRIGVQLVVISTIAVMITGRPVPERVPVQCGESTCDILNEYCYQGKQCYKCNVNVCNTFNFDDGALAQCYFYCDMLDKSKLQIPTPANNTGDVGIRMEIYLLVLIIIGSIAIGAVACWLFKWFRNRQDTNGNNNGKDHRAIPISPPQDKHSGNTNPRASENDKMLISKSRHVDQVDLESTCVMETATL